MRLEKGKFTIELDYEELRELAYALKHDMLQSIDDHYNKLQQNQDGEPVFNDHCKLKVNLLKELSGLQGGGIFEDFEYMKNKAFENRRKEREANK